MLAQKRGIKRSGSSTTYSLMKSSDDSSLSDVNNANSTDSASFITVDDMVDDMQRYVDTILLLFTQCSPPRTSSFYNRNGWVT